MKVNKKLKNWNIDVNGLADSLVPAVKSTVVSDVSCTGEWFSSGPWVADDSVRGGRKDRVAIMNENNTKINLVFSHGRCSEQFECQSAHSISIE